jgi:hypothetical protein
MKCNKQKLIADIVLQCVKNHITFVMSDKDHVMADGIKCSGFYDDSVLSIATGREDWLDVLVHESCHMDQSLEQVPLWTQGDSGIQKVDKWLKNNKSYGDKIMQTAFRDTILLELDCEKRTIKKFKKYQVPLNEKNYIQKCNAYLFSYWASYRSKQWVLFPYNNPKIVGKMPCKFLGKEEYNKPDSMHVSTVLEGCSS